MVIDSHQHFWKYDPVRDTWIDDSMSVLKRNFLPAEICSLLNTNNIDGCISVQADQSELETEFLLELAKEFDFIKAVVGWVDLRSDKLKERLEYFSRYKKLKGFRHVVQGEPKGFLTNEKFVRGVRMLAQYNFTYDLLIYNHQFEEALKFLSETENVKIVIDHLAKPSIKTKEKTHWELNMAAAGSLSNVCCKLSGMVTEADWSSWKKEDFTPYLDEMFEIFGAERILYGSDWPVCLLAGSYEDQFSIVADYLTRLTHREKEMVMGKNAERFYNL